MGVKDLWDILSPVGDSCSLDVLKNKTVAVDLSGWILKSQKQKELCKVRYAHLRNLFFRTSHLLKLGAKPVFVIEGEAPALKKEVLIQRAQSQEQPSNSICLRKRFRQILNECKEMIESLGLICIQSSGEAEATCAFLNMNKVVDGCITDDSDAFLYGAETVYRNFSIDPKDPHIDVYKMTDIETKLNLDRRKLVALALLLGCDYCQAGVPGVGKEKAMGLFKNLKELDVLERFEKWRNGSLFDSVDTSLLKKNLTHCEICRHPGTEKRHVKDGCEFCGSTHQCIKNNVGFQCGCSWHQAQNVKIEFYISEIALQDPQFPSKEIIKEFLEFKEPINCRKVQWVRPSLTDFEEIIARTLCWTMEKTREKLFPLITLWQIRQIISQPKRKNQEISQNFVMEPSRIIKECIRKSVKFFEVEWMLKGYEAADCNIITIEVIDSFKQAYPRLTEMYYGEYQKATDNSRKRKEKALPNTTHKKSSKQERGIVASHKSKKVSKDKWEMSLPQTVDIDSVTVDDICVSHAKELSHSKKTSFDLQEMLNIPLSERIMRTKISQLSMNKDILKSSDKLNGAVSKNKLLQDSCYASSLPPSSFYVNDKCSSLENKLLLFDNDGTNKSGSLIARQIQYEIIGLTDQLQNCQLSESISSDDSMDELFDRIAKKEFKHSIICIDSDSDDDFPEGIEICDSGIVLPSGKEKRLESEIIADVGLCKNLPVDIGSSPGKDENYEFSPLPLRERLKNKFL